MDAIDIIPTAIEIARHLARERHLAIHYAVQDICQLPHEGKRYDLIVDSYCLQGIVTDRDRGSVFAAVQARLKPTGYYVVSTAIFDPARRSLDTVVDRSTGAVYHRYGDAGLIEVVSGMVYVPLAAGPAGYEEAVQIQDRWYLPSRRHRTPAALVAELERVGFTIQHHERENVICMYRR